MIADETPSPVEVRYSRAHAGWTLVTLASVAVAFAFSHSVLAGCIVLGIVVASGPILAPRYLGYIATLPAPLLLDGEGIRLHRGHIKTLIPWSDIEDVGFRTGGRGRELLCFRVRHPDKYLSRPLRFNFLLSYFHIRTPIDGLDCAPCGLMNQIQIFRKAYDQQNS